MSATPNPKPIEGERKAFIMGNEAVVWACLAAGADSMFGYPITPQNQVMHYWTQLAPKYNKIFLQTEDEISAGFAVIGSVLAGKKSFTATAGPGNVIMQDAFSMAEMMRIPIVILIMQRGGPSTATVIYSQQELFLTVHGGNGEGLRIVYSTSGSQDLFDYMIKAFNVAWKYRFPTFVMGDGYQAESREPVVLYDPEARGIKMVEPEPYVGKPGSIQNGRKPNHLRNTYSMEEELEEVVNDLATEFEKIRDEVVEYDSFGCDDAELVVVSHGIVSRACKHAVHQLREEGHKIGYFRPITISPFPDREMKEALQNARGILFVESSLGQLAFYCKSYLYGMTLPVYSLFRPGVGVTSEEVKDKVMEIAGVGVKPIF